MALVFIGKHAWNGSNFWWNAKLYTWSYIISSWSIWGLTNNLEVLVKTFCSFSNRPTVLFICLRGRGSSFRKEIKIGIHKQLTKYLKSKCREVFFLIMFKHGSPQLSCKQTPSQTVIRMCSVKKVLLEISQNSQENTCARVCFLIKLQAWGQQLYYKRLWHMCSPLNFLKFLRTSFFTEHFRWLLLLFHKGFW